MQIVSFNDTLFSLSTNMCTAVTSKPEAGKAVAKSYHGDEAKKSLIQLGRTKDEASNYIMATAQMSV